MSLLRKCFILKISNLTYFIKKVIEKNPKFTLLTTITILFAATIAISTVVTKDIFARQNDPISNCFTLYSPVNSSYVSAIENFTQSISKDHTLIIANHGLPINDLSDLGVLLTNQRLAGVELADALKHIDAKLATVGFTEEQHESIGYCITEIAFSHGQ